MDKTIRRVTYLNNYTDAKYLYKFITTLERLRLVYVYSFAWPKIENPCLWKISVETKY